jgi:hypothetical protein
VTAAPGGRGPLGRDLAREQLAFLGRDRAGWDEHLARIRAFLGEGLRAAERPGPVLVLGAGSGLEVPWGLAPGSAVGWDADPWSRLRTLLRHRRWVPWVFEDLTGGLGDLAAVARRTTRLPWSGRLLATPAAGRRLAGLIEALRPGCAPLRAWIQDHRPAVILSANVMGQFGAVAERLVERAFGGRMPGPADPEDPDPLDQALRDWTARAVRAYLAVLADSGADLWLVHDRAVLFGQVPVSLGPMEEAWTAQLRADGPVEAMDPLCGVEIVSEIKSRPVTRHQRWLWPVAPGQIHVVEAVRIPSGAGILES